MFLLGDGLIYGIEELVGLKHIVMWYDLLWLSIVYMFSFLCPWVFIILPD